MRDERQCTVADWVVRCWGEQVLQSAPERGGRLLEESLELAQAVGLTREKAQTILDYVYGRPGAALLNWHRAISGETNAMRPGIDTPAWDVAREGDE